MVTDKKTKWKDQFRDRVMMTIAQDRWRRLHLTVKTAWRNNSLVAQVTIIKFLTAAYKKVTEYKT